MTSTRHGRPASCTSGTQASLRRPRGAETESPATAWPSAVVEPATVTRRKAAPGTVETEPTIWRWPSSVAGSGSGTPPSARTRRICPGSSAVGNVDVFLEFTNSAT